MPSASAAISGPETVVSFRLPGHRKEQCNAGSEQERSRLGAGGCGERAEEGCWDQGDVHRGAGQVFLGVDWGVAGLFV